MQEVKFLHSDKVISGGRAQKFNCSQAYLAITALPFSAMELHSAASRLLMSLSVFSHIWKHSAKAPLISCHIFSQVCLFDQSVAERVRLGFEPSH